MNYLDVTNDGLIPGVNLNQEANALWSSIEQRVHDILGDDWIVDGLLKVLKKITTKLDFLLKKLKIFKSFCTY